MPSARKLRILSFHGYHGSAETLRSQAAPLVSELESLAEFVFIDAPSLAAGDFGWWHAAPEDPGVEGTRRHYQGWARSRDAITLAFAEKGPFDGIFGFSQGAAVAGLVAGLRGEPLVKFDFAILVSGFPSNDQALAKLYENRESYALPSLHIIGRSDGIVPIARSRALAAQFVNPTIVEHQGGHVIPGERAVRDRVRAFAEQSKKEN